MGSVNAVAVTPDGREIVSASDKAVQVWDLATGQLLRTLTGHTAIVWAPRRLEGQLATVTLVAAAPPRTSPPTGRKAPGGTPGVFAQTRPSNPSA